MKNRILDTDTLFILSFCFLSFFLFYFFVWRHVLGELPLTVVQWSEHAMWTYSTVLFFMSVHPQCEVTCRKQSGKKHFLLLTVGLIHKTRMRLTEWGNW